MIFIKFSDSAIDAQEKDESHKWLTFSLFFPGDTPLPWMGSFDSSSYAFFSLKS